MDLNTQVEGFTDEHGNTWATFDHATLDAWAKRNGMMITHAPWHPNPSYTYFKTGTGLDAGQYPSGLIIVDETGKPTPWKPA